MSADLFWRRGADKFVAFHRVIDVSNKFYEILSECPKDHVVKSTNEDGTDGVPYKPTWFPVGPWNIPRPRSLAEWARISIYTAPYFIPTDAHQLVDVWELDENGLYKCPAGILAGEPRKIMDWGYGIHHSEIDYTFGCLRVIEKADMLWLAPRVLEALQDGPVQFEVAA